MANDAKVVCKNVFKNCDRAAQIILIGCILTLIIHPIMNLH